MSRAPGQGRSAVRVPSPRGQPAAPVAGELRGPADRGGAQPQAIAGQAGMGSAPPAERSRPGDPQRTSLLCVPRRDEHDLGAAGRASATTSQSRFSNETGTHGCLTAISAPSSTGSTVYVTERMGDRMWLGYLRVSKTDGSQTTDLQRRVSTLCRESGVTRQTQYRHVAPDGSIRPDGRRLLEWEHSVRHSAP
jgi:hypothetical protein